MLGPSGLFHGKPRGLQTMGAALMPHARRLRVNEYVHVL